MGSHPLIELATARETKQVKGFRTVATQQNGEGLAALYRQELDSVPRRADAGKKYLGGRDGQLEDPAPDPRDEVHLATALFNCARGAESGIILPHGGGATVDWVDYSVPMKATRSDKGVGDVDLLGVTSEERLVVVEMKYVSPEAARGPAGENPVRALFEGLAYCAMAQANQATFASEIAESLGRSLSEEPPILMVLGNRHYWGTWRKRETQKGAAWIKELERLATEIHESLKIPVRYHTIGEPNWEYVEGRPTLIGAPSMAQAWEPGAGRVRPRARPKTKILEKERLVEADLSRPVRSYALSESYSPGDRIQHPTLGLGVVQGVAGRAKIEVLFDGKKSLLVHERPAPMAPSLTS